LSEPLATDLVAIRLATTADLPFVVHTWVKTFSRSDHAHAIRTCIALRQYEPLIGDYRTLHRNLVLQLLTTCDVYVACSKDDTDYVVGYVVGDPATRTLQYVCIKKAYHGEGVAKMLVSAMFPGPDPINYTHQTDDIDEKRLPKQFIYKGKMLP
jgi:hypothetical protein